MKLTLISNDINLQKCLENTDYFEEVNIEVETSKIKEIDSEVLVISDKEISINDIIANYENYQNKKIIFYLLSDIERESQKADEINNIIDICKSKGITVIPSGSTTKQITEDIIKTIFPNYDKNNNMITFFGADSKVGTTMIAQSIAENFAENTDVKVGLLFLNSNKSTFYIKNGNVSGIDELKVKIMNKMLSSSELVECCVRKNNLYILPGINNLLEVRYYFPEHIEYLLDIAKDTFDVVFIDAGHNIDCAMALTALRDTKHKYLVATQQEIARKNFERIQRQTFKQLKFKTTDFMIIVNKFIDSNAVYSASQVAELYKMTLAGYISYLELLGWQAEFDNKSLLKYNDEEYNFQINEICRLIATQLNVLYKNNPTKKKGIFKKAFSEVGSFL